jgi:hypothetical protein
VDVNSFLSKTSYWYYVRKFKQWWSTIPAISTKWIAISCLKSLNIKKKTMAYADNNSDLCLGHAQKCDRDTPFNGGVSEWLLFNAN